MHDASLLRDLALVLALGGAVTALFHRLRQPVVLGYILAGVLIGPGAAPFSLIHDRKSVETLAELGVILLLFSIGTEASLRRLRRVGGVALIAASLEMPLILWLGYSVGRLAAWSTADSLFIGAILSISSTTIILKVLMDLGQSRAEFARIILGILVVQDVAVVVMLVLLAGFASAGTVAWSDLVVALGEVVLFVVAVTIVGLLVLPRLLHVLARMSAEVLTVSTLGLCFGVAILAGELGFSVALGAFLIGAVVAETREARRIQEQIEPVRDMFSAMFFVAVGLSIDLSAFLEHWRVVLLLSVVSVAGKIATCTFGTLVAGYSPRAALRVGMALAPIGEFSFVIANLGRSAGVLSDFLYPVTVAVSALTILATPYLMRSADRVADALESWAPQGMREFLAFYDRRLGGFARRRPGWRLPEETRWPIVRLTIAGALVLALLQLTRSLVAAARRRGEFFGAFADHRDVLVWSAAGVLALPLSIAMWRSTGELAEVLLRRLSGRVEGNRVIVEAFRFTLTVIAALVFLAIASPFFPTGIPLLVTGGLVGLSAFVFWRSLVAVQEDAERTIAAIFSTSEGESAAPAQARSELTHLISQKYSFEVVLEDFILPFSKTAANCTIRDLALRSRFGVTIAAIYREERAVVSPDPDTRLEPGDVLLLLGSREQIAAGMQHLDHLAGQPPP